MKEKKNWKSKLKVSFLLFSVVLYLFLNPVGVSAQDEVQGNVIKVGFFPVNGFQEYDTMGNPSGYMVDYLNKIAEYTGWNYMYVKTDSFDEAYRYLRAGKIDILAPVRMREDFADTCEFSAYSIGLDYGVLMTREGNPSLVYEDFDCFKDVRIGCIKDKKLEEDFSKYSANYNFSPKFKVFPDTQALQKALREREIDIVMIHYSQANPDMKILGKFEPASVYFLYPNKDTALGDDLNHALMEIKLDDPEFENHLMRKYFPVYYETPFQRDEMEYIQGTDTIRIGCPTAWDPISYCESGDIVKGLSRSILDKLSENSGLNFEFVPVEQQNMNTAYYLDNGIDAVLTEKIADDSRVSKGMRLTDPYLNTRNVLVGRKGENFDKNTNLVLVIPQTIQSEAPLLASTYSHFKIMTCKTTEDCLEAVYSGKADVLLQNQYAIEYYLTKPKYKELSVIPLEGVDTELCLSIITARVTDERLSVVINKSISMIPESELERCIISEMTDHNYSMTLMDFAYQYHSAIIIFCIGAAIAIMLLLFIGRLSRKNHKLIEENEQRLLQITDNINGGVIKMLPSEGLPLTYVNEGFLNLVQYTREEYEQEEIRNFEDFVHSEDWSALRDDLKELLLHGRKLSVQIRVLRKDGTVFPCIIKGTVAGNVDGINEVYGVVLDITETNRMMEQLELEQKRYNLIIEKSEEMIFEVNLETNAMKISPKFEQKFGWTFPDKMEGDTIEDRIKFWKVHEEDKPTLIALIESLNGTDTENEGIFRLLDSNGDATWVRLEQYPMKNHKGQIIEIVGRIVDVDLETKEKERLIEKSERDMLTGLYNKEAFEKIAREYLENNPDHLSAVIFLDLDNFKKINDYFGHLTGDQAICDAATKLQVIFSNLDIICRFGGDEFCILVKDIPMNTLIGKLEWALDKMKETYRDVVHVVTVTASIGVALSPKHSSDFEELLSYADTALYYSKEKGKNQYQIYTSSIKLQGYEGRKEEDS